MDSVEKPKIFCPVCSTGREVPQLKIPTQWLVLWSLLWGFFVGLTVGLVSGIYIGFLSAIVGGMLCFIGFEVYYGLKFKRELECPVCHFDPVLYRKSPEEAKKKCLESIEGKQKPFLEKWRALKKQQLVEENL